MVILELGLACARLFASGLPPGFLDVPSERTVGLNFRTEFTMILGPIPAEASSFFGVRVIVSPRATKRSTSPEPYGVSRDVVCGPSPVGAT